MSTAPSSWGRNGKLIVLTGYEGTGKCYWCGGENKRSRHYCCRQCYNNYYDNFYWPWARAKALERENHCCQRCGVKTDEVHHIVPLGDGDRMWNVLNKQDNLEVLCAEHHLLTDTERRREGKLLAKGQLDLPLKVPRQRSQPVPVGQMELW